ncbi:MAG: hypothetical protein ACOY4H_13865, partial [Thermodesulfobacteriota bacterium]
MLLDNENENLKVSWLSVNWTFGPFVINHHERREVHAKKALQLHLGGESFYPQVSWLSVNWTFGPFVINHHERREVHAKKALQLHLGGESFYPQA